MQPAAAHAVWSCGLLFLSFYILICDCSAQCETDGKSYAPGCYIKLRLNAIKGWCDLRNALTLIKIWQAARCFMVYRSYLKMGNTKKMNPPSKAPSDFCSFNHDDIISTFSGWLVFGKVAFVVSRNSIHPEPKGSKQVARGRKLPVWEVLHFHILHVLLRAPPGGLTIKHPSPLPSESHRVPLLQPWTHLFIYSLPVGLKMHEPFVIFCPITHKVAAALSKTGDRKSLRPKHDLCFRWPITGDECQTEESRTCRRLPATSS